MNSAASQNDHRLDPDTQAVLLLCGWFGKPAVGSAPLSITEYNAVARWLHRHEMRPGDLLGNAWQRLGEVPVSAERLRALLGRGVALAIALENWTGQGLWVLSRSDIVYPRQLKARLGRLAPPILYGAGSGKERIPGGGLAIVGALAAASADQEYASAVATACAEQEIAVISSVIPGDETSAMEAALAAGGRVVGVVADNLAKVAASRRIREALQEAQLILLSPLNPQAGFNASNVAVANSVIYALADWALIVSPESQERGTWEGAVEALKTGSTSIFVRPGEEIPEGTRRLIELGGHSFPEHPWTDLAQRLGAAVQKLTAQDGT